jgi:omega-amidase
MLVSALSLAGIDLGSIDGYLSGLKKALIDPQPLVAVLPAHSALALGLGLGRLNSGKSFKDTFAVYVAEGSQWTGEYLELHGHLSKKLQIYLAAGTVIEKEKGRYYQSIYCFNPGGQVCCLQRQTHLTCFERDLHLSRGDSLDLFQVENFLLGLVAGNDARHPEVGRIMALQGADLLLHCGALEGNQTCWSQTAAMWAQVQQNQVFAVEAQLSITFAGLSFGAALAITAPCEITFGHSGYLTRGNPDSSRVWAKLDRETLIKVRNDNPLLKLLNPEAYSELFGGEPC